MELLWGWLVVLFCAGVVIGLLIAFVDDIERFIDPDNDPDPTGPTVAEDVETQVIRIIPTTVDTVVVDNDEPQVIPGELVDELGAWRPWEYELEQPLILGHVLMSGNWEGLRANELGMVAA